jgi:hypothetical protein
MQTQTTHGLYLLHQIALTPSKDEVAVRRVGVQAGSEDHRKDRSGLMLSNLCSTNHGRLASLQHMNSIDKLLRSNLSRRITALASGLEMVTHHHQPFLRTRCNSLHTSKEHTAKLTSARR